LSDAERTVWLEKMGFKIIRFTNEEVLFNIEETIRIIKENIK
jgi:very-short-patch-repair endonuclease